MLFGSVARGQTTTRSDIDLLVIADGFPRSLLARRRPLLAEWSRVRARHGLPAVEWNLVTKSPEEAQCHTPLYLDVVGDGILLIDRGGFFHAVLDAMRERMRELWSRRGVSRRRKLVLGPEAGLPVRRCRGDMTNRHMGRRYVEEAGSRVELVRIAAERAMWATVVREAQECVEPFLKGALRIVAVEPVRTHDVADVPRREARRFPKWFRSEVEHLASISTEMAGDRGVAYCSDDRQNIGAVRG